MELKHQKYYDHGGIEAIDVIHAWELDFDLGNVIKYISRAGLKDQTKKLEDLQKAKTYLEFAINEIEKKEREYARISAS